MTDDTKSSTTSSESSSSSSSPSSTSESSSSGGKSSRESVGGKSEVHYGYFSNIKTPEYKSGWDDIWGKKKSGSWKAAGRKKAAPKAMEPESVEIDFAVLPESVRTALTAAAAEQLKKKRVSYAARDKRGAIVWRIACEVKR